MRSSSVDRDHSCPSCWKQRKPCEAGSLLEQVTPGGKAAAKSLERLLNLKDEAHYGLFDVGGQDLKSALRQASALVEFAAEVLHR
jgi:hypothetical protein